MCFLSAYVFWGVFIALILLDHLSFLLQIYIFLEGVDREKMETEIKPTSIDIKLHDVQGKNYRCGIPKLHKQIVPEKCKVLVKPTRVVITLIKASKENWLDLHFKEDKVSLCHGLPLLCFFMGRIMTNSIDI